MLFLGVVLVLSASSGHAMDVPSILSAAPTLQSLQNTLKLLSAESVNTARAVAGPVLDLVNQTASEAHSALEDLSVETLKSVLKARARGWDAYHCATAKQAEAEEAIKSATAKLDNCVALAAIEVSNPVSVIENLTQEAIVRVDAASGEVANCFYSINTLQCLFDMVREMMQQVEDMSRTISKQAVGAEQSITHVTEYVENCAKNQVEVASNFLQKLDISACNEEGQEQQQA